MSKFRSFAVWILEMLCEAVGTTLWMGLLAFLQYGPDRSQHTYPYGYLGVIVGVSGVVLLEFTLTGYLLTTLLLALSLPRRQWLAYPSASSGLYFIHSSIFFVLAGNRLLNKDNLAIQVGGACIAFMLTSFGDRLRRVRPSATR